MKNQLQDCTSQTRFNHWWTTLCEASKRTVEFLRADAAKAGMDTTLPL